MKDQVFAFLKSKPVIFLIAIGIIALAAFGGLLEGIF